ncbi:MAG: YybS family protein [Candidatus Thiodiazotropha sp. (ex Epidulcina cf. delphinae)]|nr:YybS family protein [Candidatus Thiodiazotropha sp. (ex Epidulcina cf. delphinae)]
MKALASFVMRGPSQSAMATTVLTMLALIFPFVGILGSACVGLVFLRLGMMAGVKTLLLSTLAVGLLMGVVFGNPLPALGILLVAWLPIGLLGMLLRNTHSLGLTTQAGIGFGLLAIVLQYVVLGQPKVFWREYLQPMGQSFVEAGLLDQAQSLPVIEQVSGVMCGVVAVLFLLQLLCSLYLARWWQAVLYNPGGFAGEYRQLRVHWMVGLVGVLALPALLMPGEGGPAFFLCLGAVFLGVLFLQGLAVVHGVFKGLKSVQLWLVLTYLLLIVFMPQMVLVLTGIGLTDVWIDYRTRFKDKPSG